MYRLHSTKATSLCQQLSPEQLLQLISMAALLQNVTRSIWHAFNALQQDKSGLVHKSKLKVLTANIGTLLDLYGVEKGLEHYRSTNTLHFGHYKYYLKKEVFASLPDTLTLSELRDYESRIDEVCWLVCRKRYISRDRPVFPDSTVYQLFRIFCLLADLIPEQNGSEVYQVVLHHSEAGAICQQFVLLLGLTWDQTDWARLRGSVAAFPFATFLALLETKYCGGGQLEQTPIEEAVGEMFQTFLQDVIKRGYLMKRGYLLPTLREYWFVLQPCELSYYKSPSERDLCGTIRLDPGCLVEPVMGKDKVKRINLITTDRHFELGMQDHKSRLQWISALRLAIVHSGGHVGYQRGQAVLRRHQREFDFHQESLKYYEELKRRENHALEVQETKTQLELEKMARVAAETQARELEAFAKTESHRLAELQNVRATLEKLLEEETQAKHDEEIVRALQARVLTEEWSKREELEQLQEEQRLLLENERQKRLEFEQRQKEKEEQLKEAEQRLKQLEGERLKLDKELETARSKIVISEESKEVFEARLRVMSPLSREGDKVRRAISFMPSTKERPVHVEVRASTLKRPSKPQP